MTDVNLKIKFENKSFATIFIVQRSPSLHNNSSNFEMTVYIISVLPNHKQLNIPGKLLRSNFVIQMIFRHLKAKEHNKLVCWNQFVVSG